MCLTKEQTLEGYFVIKQAVKFVMLPVYERIKYSTEEKMTKIIPHYLLMKLATENEVCICFIPLMMKCRPTYLVTRPLFVLHCFFLLTNMLRFVLED